MRRVLITAGALVTAYALYGALTDPDVKGGALIFLIGVLVAHDGILLPVTIAAGVLIGKLIPFRLRAVTRAALVASLAVTVVALPAVLGKGRTADNPSLLPLHYGRGLLETYGVIWLAAAAVQVRHAMAGVSRWSPLITIFRRSSAMSLNDDDITSAGQGLGGSGEGPADGGANPGGQDGGADGGASGEGPADGGANPGDVDGGADGGASGEGPADGGANPNGADGGADGSASGGDQGPADGGANPNGHDGGADGSAY